MKNHNRSKMSAVISCFIGWLFVIWFAVLIAPALLGGSRNGPNIIEVWNRASPLVSRPFSVQWTQKTVSTIVTLSIIYVVAIGMYIATRRNTRDMQEYGSAQWGNVHELSKRYTDRKEPFQNHILTDNFSIALNTRLHERTLNVLVIGGTGTGKSRYYVKPNLLQANCSYIVLDPKGELLNATGHLLQAQGHEIRVLDLINPERSMGYNPFRYLRREEDVMALVENIIRTTTPKDSQKGEPFWENADKALLASLIFLLYENALPHEQYFAMLLDCMNYMNMSDDDDSENPMDVLMNGIEHNNPNSLAVQQYRVFRRGAGKTMKSVMMSTGVRLQGFLYPALDQMTRRDEMDFYTMGTKKVALFCCLPVDDHSKDFIVTILYTQLFQTMMWQAKEYFNGCLPVHVHFLMDEFANIAAPDRFEVLLATIRSYGISASIILQSISQLKKLYEKDYEGIIANCDELLFLGSNEQFTHKFISEFMGKETLDTTTFGRSRGQHGNYSTNYQRAGRELMTPDEVRMLNNRDALLLIRGERPVIDRKYNLLKHPNIKHTVDGGAPLFDYTEDIERPRYQPHEIEACTLLSGDEVIAQMSSLKM